MAKERGRIHTITECALFSALICVVSPFVIPLGAVPLSLSLFAVMLTGTVLPVKKTISAVGVYILAGCLGVPVFSGFQGGVSCLAGPTGGYIWSYLIAGALVAFSGRFNTGIRLVFAMASVAVCYIAGIAQYMLVTGADNLWGALLVCVIPFIPFDIVKTVAALFLGTRVRNILIKQNLLQ